MPNATALVDKNLNLACSSKGWYTVFSFLEKPIKNQLEYFKSNNNEWFTILEKSLNNGKEIQFRCTIGNTEITKHILWTFKPFLTEENLITGVIVTAKDVSTVVEKEIQIDKLNALLETKSEISKVGTWEYNLENNKLSWSKMTKKIHEVSEEYNPDVETAIKFYKQGHSQNRISMLVHKALENGETFQERLQIITAKGNERWILSSGKPFFKDGKITKLLGTFQDVDEQVKTELKVTESEQLLHTLVDNLPLNIFIKDEGSRKILVNKAECEYLGVKNPKELIGKSDFDLYDADVAQISRDEDLQVLKTLQPILGKETVSTRKDGKKTTFMTSKIPLLDVYGKAYALIGISIDISNLKQKEDELRRLIGITSIQNKKLVNFAHIVSHNLRSHTANFSMLLEFLINEKEQEEKDRILGMLSKASDNLLNTLDNLNEVVKINTNTNVTRESINLKKTFESVHENLIALFERNKVEFKNVIPSKLNIYGIPAYLDSIVLNLLTNAVKYRHPKRTPKITVTAEKEGDRVVFSIEDNGIGIDLNKNGDKLFGMYKTFHSNDDARGIGLYITKNQIEAMGGNIITCSELNKGTTFKVYFNEGY
ncbi:ATP-binding protein [uncultured Croceitalea sp.]|uniref:PAS domain-containing sensor histidine kinase n=1 Tax=uncultured Croceitalea sp. TaxID=1798908 RepID=UPI00374F6F45